jgi:hypothetical protein
MSFAHKLVVEELRAEAAAPSRKKTQGFSASPASRGCLGMTELFSFWEKPTGRRK